MQNKSSAPRCARFQSLLFEVANVERRLEKRLIIVCVLRKQITKPAKLLPVRCHLHPPTPRWDDAISLFFSNSSDRKARLLLLGIILILTLAILLSLRLRRPFRSILLLMSRMVGQVMPQRLEEPLILVVLGVERIRVIGER